MRAAGSDGPLAEGGSPWLVPFVLREGEAASFRIASFALQVSRRAFEWRVQTGTIEDSAQNDVDVRCPDPGHEPFPPSHDAKLMRFAFDGNTQALQLRPRLADRTVVVRPADPLYLLPGAEVDVFVSTIVWVALELAETGVTLIERPALRPSDTWFGPTTQAGELAYASRTSARLDVNELPTRPHRATTQIHLANAGRSPQSLARVMLPAPSLEMWRMPSGALWTQTVEMTLDDGEETPLRFRPGPPIARGALGAAVAIGEAQLLASARRIPQRNFLLRALSAIF